MEISPLPGTVATYPPPCCRSNDLNIMFYCFTVDYTSIRVHIALQVRDVRKHKYLRQPRRKHRWYIGGGRESEEWDPLLGSANDGRDGLVTRDNSPASMECRAHPFLASAHCIIKAPSSGGTECRFLSLQINIFHAYHRTPLHRGSIPSM